MRREIGGTGISGGDGKPGVARQECGCRPATGRHRTGHLNGAQSAHCRRAGRRRGCVACTGVVHAPMRDDCERERGAPCAICVGHGNVRPLLDERDRLDAGRTTAQPTFPARRAGSHHRYRMPPEPSRDPLRRATSRIRSPAVSFSFGIAGACCHSQASRVPDIRMFRGTTHPRETTRFSQSSALPCFNPKMKSASTDAPLGNCSTPTDERAWTPASPSTAYRTSDAPSATSLCIVKSGVLRT